MLAAKSPNQHSHLKAGVLNSESSPYQHIFAARGHESELRVCLVRLPVSLPPVALLEMTFEFVANATVCHCVANGRVGHAQ